MLSRAQVSAAARRLGAAEKSRAQIGLPPLEHPQMDMADAYAIQAAWVEQKCAAGRSVRGHKIGLTSRAMQQALNIGTPDSGALPDDMFFDDEGDIPTARFIATRIEAELAFVAMTLALAQGRSAEARRDAGSAVFKALEAALAPAFAAGPLALSFEMREIEDAFSFKANTVHAALAGNGKA